jgi:hypothetical protein
VIPDPCERVDHGDSPSSGGVLRQQQRLIEAALGAARRVERHGNEQRFAGKELLPLGRFREERRNPRREPVRPVILERVKDSVERGFVSRA